ncbi:hypothetical protein FSPOR_8087 [Fusarium sporotrichioides]|uniref:Uncharacterized protein n=1 Tax=Fusarium sporotrichioides TaxID=5514 RepID=A0A395RW66_FUSSP|nr:hypothetical protein FSPOR_8087 [Fusarium sporotrichioides]
MKLSTFSILTHLASPGSTAAIGLARNAALKTLSVREDVDWSSNVYQSRQRCTGARDNFSGKRSKTWTQGTRNGSIGSYTAGDIVDGWTVYIYNDNDCDSEGVIGILTRANQKNCRQPLLEVSTMGKLKVECKW